MRGSGECYYFDGYGYLCGITYCDYLFNLLDWVYVDSDAYGTLIVQSELTGEIVFVEGSGDYV